MQNEDIKTENKKDVDTVSFLCFSGGNDIPTIFELKESLKEILLVAGKCQKQSGFLITKNKKGGNLENVAAFLGR